MSSIFFYVMNNGFLHNDVNGHIIKPQRDVNFQVNVAYFFREFILDRIFNFIIELL